MRYEIQDEERETVLETLQGIRNGCGCSSKERIIRHLDGTISMPPKVEALASFYVNLKPVKGEIKVSTNQMG